MAAEVPVVSPLLVRERDLPALLSMSRANVRRLMAAGRFPVPIRLGAHCIAWRRVDLEQWVVSGCPAGQGGGDAK